MCFTIVWGLAKPLKIERIAKNEISIQSNCLMHQIKTKKSCNSMYFIP